MQLLYPIHLAQLTLGQHIKIMQRCSNKTDPSLHLRLPPNASEPHPSGYSLQESRQLAPDDAVALAVAEAPVTRIETSAEAPFSAGDWYIFQRCSSPPTGVPPGCWG